MRREQIILSTSQSMENSSFDNEPAEVQLSSSVAGQQKGDHTGQPRSNQDFNSARRSNDTSNDAHRKDRHTCNTCDKRFSRSGTDSTPACSHWRNTIPLYTELEQFQSVRSVVFNQWSGDHQWSLRGFQVVPRQINS